MSNKRHILPILVLISILGVISWLVPRPHEPIYEGRPLSYWLDNYDHGNPEQTNAILAVRQIGTNAIPILLRMLKTKDSKFKLGLIQVAQKQTIFNIKLRSAELQHCEALFGFLCLGSQSKSAMPALIEIYNEHRSDRCNTPGDIDQLFEYMGPAAAAAVPRLVQDTTETNDLIRSRAVETLGQIHSNPDLTVPTLTKCLHDPVMDVRFGAVLALREFGSDAKTAVPELVNMITDTSDYESILAAYALKQIDPNAYVPQSGVK